MNYTKQATDFLKSTNTEIIIKESLKPTAPIWAKDERHGIKYNVIIKNAKHHFSFAFWDSIHNQENNLKPTAYDVLACLTKYDVGSFKNFCDDFGYDTDSITAAKTYKAVKKEFANIIQLWTSSEIEKLSEIN